MTFLLTQFEDCEKSDKLLKTKTNALKDKENLLCSENIINIINIIHNKNVN